MPHAALPAILRKFWGFDTLRPLQDRAIKANLDGRDSLVVMPTGGGKSLCYQVPPLLTDQLSVVVSPLIALMKDQVDGLRLNGYPAAALNSGVSREDSAEVISQLRDNSLRLLFVAPERLLTAGMLADLVRANGGKGPRAFAIDEAHCISQWGHDFRPEYRRLAEVREVFPNAMFHTFTATATPRVRDDIVKQIGLRNPEILVGTFDRPNLTYRIIQKLDAAEQIADAIKRHSNAAAIVYCISRKDTEEIAGVLQRRGISAEPYHAGLGPEVRRRVQDQFAQEQINVVVATVAFGMGIDRSNVRCVIHAAMPKSIEHYQQETGRAGRDGLPAECLMLYSAGDAMRWNMILERGAAENGADPIFLEHQKGQVEEVRRFATGARCRHDFLSSYFGQSYKQSTDLPANIKGCGACDACLGEMEVVVDSKVIAQKILSCIYRASQASGITFGAKHITDILLGKKVANVVERGHDQLSTFGLLKGTPPTRLASFINQLIDLGVVSRASGQFPTLGLSTAATEVLKGLREVVLVMPREPVGVESGEVDFDAGCFEMLRDLRRDLAQKQAIPAFMIFGDTVLQELARCRPTTPAAFRNIRGVGERKAEQLGTLFTFAIAAYCRNNNLPADLPSTIPSRRPKPKSDSAKPISIGKSEAFAMFRRGCSIEQTAHELERAASTVWQYLEEYIEREKPESTGTWVSDATYARVCESFARIGGERLKPIFDDLKGEVLYEQIRVVAAHRRALGLVPPR